LNDAEHVLMSAATYLELSIVIDGRKDPALSREVDDFLDRLSVEIEPVTPEQARIARDAYRDYGRGSGHAANLNFGDCFSYALARAMREPILFKGEDFIHTDLRSAVPTP
jgi:ribonuclease VapC